ncbi:WhiB family transcriptional regulator [Saccharothrix sp. ST-888]|uniref:WhiB family transcriptional regulator n=1 Tax=Saccharothrix sp. ST-888 TaxID=1427391 RepID=UPI0005EC024D|nr:WhiB family transcriptional regulator [Saccharothrix sp. ST-888]KJK58856.1 WhiB family transcriptional regulator [Saccharothrix sp. ST-888]
MLHPIESSVRTAVVVAGRRSPAGPVGTGTQQLDHPEDSPWHTGAACRRDEAGLFFAPSKEPTAARLSREEQAKQVCARCPVLLECREHALVQPEPYGVWGGLTAAERRVVLARRRRRDGELREARRVGEPRRIAG